MFGLFGGVQVWEGASWKMLRMLRKLSFSVLCLRPHATESLRPAVLAGVSVFPSHPARRRAMRSCAPRPVLGEIHPVQRSELLQTLHRFGWLQRSAEVGGRVPMALVCVDVLNACRQ